MIVMTATYGLGDPPTNAASFASAIKKHAQPNTLKYCVLGFGSHGYPDFCKFAYEVDNLLARQPWAIPVLEIHTINDKSPLEFGQWAETWSQQIGIPLAVSDELLKTERTYPFTVVSKTTVSTPGDAFLIKLQPENRLKFASGDLLAIHPANDHRERLYSIGKIGKEVQLSVKLHQNGLGSGYLSELTPGSLVHARIVSNPHFHFPDKSASVIMISNGTGIAPFLGMIDQQHQGIACHLYCGFRDERAFALYKTDIEKNIDSRKLSSLKIAYSRQGQKQYVKDLLQNDETLIADTLSSQGVIMLCGSLSMQNNVVELLENICQKRLGKSVSYYQSRNQVLMDCY